MEKESGLTLMTKDEAMAFVEKIAAKVKTAKNSEEAFILTKVITADLQLNHYNNREKTKVNLAISGLRSVVMRRVCFFLFEKPYS